MKRQRKTALWKDAFREVRKTKSRFFSIFLIVALGAGFFAGIKATGPDMKLTGDAYFDEQDLMDIKALSTYGLNGDDIAALEADEMVKAVEPAHSVDTLVHDGEKSSVIKVLGLPGEGGINAPRLMEGRLPEAENECLIQYGGHLSRRLQIGDTVTLSPGKEGEALSDTLRESSYTVVGVAQCPLYITFSMGTTSIGSGTVDDLLLIPDEAFVLDYYTEAYLTLKGAAELDCFGEEYGQLVAAAKTRLEGVGEARAQARYDEIYEEAAGKLDDAQAELDQARADGQAELDAAKKKLDSAAAELQSAKSTLDASEKKLADAKSQIAAGEAAIPQNQAAFDEKIAAGQAELEQSRSQLAQLEQGIAALQGQLAAMGDPAQLPPELQAQYQALAGRIQGMQAQLDGGRAQLAKGEAALAAAKKDGQAQLDQARADLTKAKSDYQQGLAKYQTGLAQYQQGQREYRSGAAEYESAKASFATQIADGQEEIDENRAKLADIALPKWYLYDRDGNVGYSGFADDADRIDAISLVFPVFFFAVAALVCLTTMTRMVEEQRTQAGTVKALGYGSGAVICKYLLYAVTAAVLGAVFGIVGGLLLFPNVIFNAYAIMYRMTKVIAPIRLDYLLWITLGSAACAALAVLYACVKELRETPSQLMRPKAPKAGKRVLLERVGFVWDRLSFIGKVTVRNLFRYKKRIAMTVLGIAGCTALMMAGFGVKDSISDIVSIQFGELDVYDGQVVFDEDTLAEDREDFDVLLAGQLGLGAHQYAREKSVTAGSDSRQLELTLVVPEEPERLGEQIVLRTRRGHEPIPLTDEGAVLSEKAANLMGVSAGDEIFLVADSGEQLPVKVAAITENYAFHYLYLSPAYYRQVFGEEIRPNTLLLQMDDPGQEGQDALSGALLEHDGVLMISYTSGIKNSFGDTVTSLNYVVLVLIVSAGALAFVVLYNLTNINVAERLREIATIKVLGFYDKEVSAYIFRENVALTLMGTVAGLLGGIWLHRFVITTAEIDTIMFGRTVAPLSYLLSAALTILFAVLVNLAMHFHLKKVDMVESLKSVE